MTASYTKSDLLFLIVAFLHRALCLFCLLYLPQKQYLELKGARIFSTVHCLTQWGPEFCTSTQYLHLQLINRWCRTVIIHLLLHAAGVSSGLSCARGFLLANMMYFWFPCYLFPPKRLHCELLTRMQFKPHVIALQSVELSVRSTHHSGKNAPDQV